MTASETTLHAASPSRLAARSFAIDPQFDLLDFFDGDGFAWFDGEQGFVASGVAAVVAPAQATALLSSIGHWAGAGAVPAGAGPRAIGALPFQETGELIVPARIIGRDASGRAWQTVIDGVDAPAVVRPTSETAAPGSFTVASMTTRDEWRASVDQVLSAIRHGDVEKVVLARAVTVDADRPFDIRAVLAHLRRSQPGCIVYADRGYAGASPELLVRKTGSTVVARPLAGTGVDTTTLVRSRKDAREHALVVDAVIEALGRSCVCMRADGPAPVELADVSHFATTVTARTRSDDTSIADLVAALHPTPAVGGTPREASLAMIDALEPDGRGRYAGPCGWIDRHGDGEFVLALRGAEIDGTCAVLHAGAGIVDGSDPATEWVETQQKFTPMLQALVRP
jgi:menaquinone-specific isochorismate synthase